MGKEINHTLLKDLVYHTLLSVKKLFPTKLNFQSYTRFHLFSCLDKHLVCLRFYNRPV